MPEQPNPWLSARTRDGDSYDAVYEQRAAAGEDVHGEAKFLGRYRARRWTETA